MPDEVSIEVDIAQEKKASDVGVFTLGDPSKYACPECHGVLLQLKNVAPLRFRCHTGHGYTVESLLSEMDDMIEDSLWSAIRALEERVMLVRHAGEHLVQAGGGDALLEDAEATQRRADIVRQAVMGEAATSSRRASG